MSEDRYSKRKRYVEVLDALKDLPSKLEVSYSREENFYYNLP